MDERAPEMLKPTLTAGVVAGFLTALPGLNLINTCTCCSMVLACGLLASYLYSRDCRQANVAFGPGNAWLVGLIAGVFYAVATTVVGTVVAFTVGSPVTQSLLEWFQRQPDVPPEAMESIDQVLEQLESRTFNVLQMLFGFFTNVLVGAVFSTLGGLLGGALFKFNPPPAEAVPPAPYTER